MLFKKLTKENEMNSEPSVIVQSYGLTEEQMKLLKITIDDCGFCGRAIISEIKQPSTLCQCPLTTDETREIPYLIFFAQNIKMLHELFMALQRNKLGVIGFYSKIEGRVVT